MAQHGQSELHQEVHQALERRLVHAGDHPEGTESKKSVLWCVQGPEQTLQRFVNLHLIHVNYLMEEF